MCIEIECPDPNNDTFPHRVTPAKKSWWRVFGTLATGDKFTVLLEAEDEWSAFDIAKKYYKNAIGMTAMKGEAQ